jgi:hypothetical protein
VDGILDWYLLGIVVGLGVAAGVMAVGGLAPGRGRVAWAVLAVGAAAGAVVIAVLALEWWAIVAAAGAASIGFVSFRRLSSDALPAAALVSLALAAVPAGGYVLAVSSPLVGQRLGRRADSRYAGLRILAKD